MKKQTKSTHILKIAVAAIVAILLILFAVMRIKHVADKPSITMDNANVTLGNYVGIEVSMDELTVTDDDVNNYIESMLYSYNQTAESERKVVEDGDSVQVTAYIYDDSGNLLTDDNGNEGFINIGSHTTYEELEQGIIGMNVGDEFDISITFPDPYEYDESFSGKKATCKGTINYIKETNEVTIDTITDEQAKDIFSADSKADINKTVRTLLEEQNKESMEQTAYGIICDYLLETCIVEPFPDLELKNRMDRQMAQLEQMCNEYYGMTLDGYYDMIGVTEQDYRADIEKSLSDTLKLELIFTAIGDQEDIQYDETEFQTYINSAMEEFGYESVDEIYGDYGEDYVRSAFRIEYVINWLIDNAHIVYTESNQNTVNEQG